MTENDECPHNTTIQIKGIKGSICLSCGKIEAQIGGTEVKGQLYKTDALRRCIIDKLGEWYSRDKD